MKQTIVFAFLLFSLTGLLFPPSSIDAQSSTIMPDWFKNNAKWWSEGLITDSDMINGLESLIIQDVIPLDKFVKASSGIEHQAGVPKGGTFVQIPKYQKDVFDWWSQDLISEGEIIDSIGHLMNEGIINSEKINKEITERKEKYNQAFGRSGLDDAPSREYGIDSRAGATVCEDDNVCDSDKGEACAKRTGETEGKCIPTWFGIMHAWEPVLNEKIPDKIIKDLYTATIYQELTTLYLLDIKNAEIGILDDARKNAWDDYSNNKNTKLQNIATALESIHKQTKEDAEFLTKYLKEIKNTQTDVEKLAKMKDIPKIDLEDAANVPLGEINDKVKPENVDEIVNAYKDAKRANQIMELHGALTDDEIIASWSVTIDPESEFATDQDFNLTNQLDGWGFDDLRAFSHNFDSLHVFPGSGEGGNVWNDDIIKTLDDGILTEEEWKNLEPSESSITSNTDDEYYLPGLDDPIKDDSADDKNPVTGEETENYWNNIGEVPILPPTGVEPIKTESLYDSNGNKIGSSNTYPSGSVYDFLYQGASIVMKKYVDGNGKVWTDKDIESGAAVFSDIPYFPPYVPTTDVDEEIETITDSSCDDCIWTTSVQFIEGKAYPMFQFMLIPRSDADPNCPNGTIGPNVMASQSYKTVYHLDSDGTGLTWNEDANNSCGNFGTWGDANKNYPITESQGNFMKEKFNFDFQFESYVP